MNEPRPPARMTAPPRVRQEVVNRSAKKTIRPLSSGASGLPQKEFSRKTTSTDVPLSSRNDRPFCDIAREGEVRNKARIGRFCNGTLCQAAPAPFDRSISQQFGCTTDIGRAAPTRLTVALS